MSDTKQGRGLKLLRTLGETALRAGGEAVKKRLTGQPEEGSVSQAALRLASGLDELKGAAMKIGQILSLADEEMVPPEWREALSRLQTQATPRSWSEMEPIIQAHLRSPEDFASIEPEAVHAASIAQVHRGHLKNGQTVAIKVVYPGVAAGLREDVENLRRITRMVDVLSADGGFDRVVDMVERTFLQETDLTLECEQYARFREMLAPYPQYVVPRVYPQYSSSQILVLDWLDGITLGKWMEAHPRRGTQAATADHQLLGLRLLELLLIEVFEMGLVQSDPNPGNFLVLPEGRLGLLDFGAVRPISHELREQLARLIGALAEKNQAGAAEAAVKLGYLQEKDSPHLQEKFFQILAIAFKPFSEDEFCWARQQLIKEVKQVGIAFATASRLRPPPAEFIFLQRRVAGTELLLERLGPRLPARQILLESTGRMTRGTSSP